jgi:chromosome segregation ATPase
METSDNDTNICKSANLGRPIMKHPPSLEKKITPEEIELEKKRNELSVLEDELTQNELDLTTLKASLEDLRQRYLRIVGVKLAQLDNIKAQIAETKACLVPEDEEVKIEADHSRAQAQESDYQVMDYGKVFKRRKGLVDPSQKRPKLPNRWL